MAARNVDCETELCLTPCGRSSNNNQKRTEMSVSGDLAGGGNELQKKISFFYGGQVFICDVTEIQARAIICMAKREMEEAMISSSQSASAPRGSWPELHAPPEPQLLSSRLSMKRSLQSFLQQRKSRACESTGPSLLQNQQDLQSDSSSSS
ncbi:protein TIFY 5A-like [Phalaenopsis equestris]|uniref:protein TIFY 5A-like n=1 Tax=Phalaenopsis equestris TaxID=78828 RepID=UPI0009E3B132|nr:protein TIFY 5A-like [Phalaenopsis equestris]